MFARQVRAESKHRMPRDGIRVLAVEAASCRDARQHARASVSEARRERNGAHDVFVPRGQIHPRLWSPECAGVAKRNSGRDVVPVERVETIEWIRLCGIELQRIRVQGTRVVAAAIVAGGTPSPRKTADPAVDAARS